MADRKIIAKSQLTNKNQSPHDLRRVGDDLKAAEEWRSTIASRIFAMFTGAVVYATLVGPGKETRALGTLMESSVSVAAE